MSKMSELSLVLDEMVSCGEELIAAARTIGACGEKMVNAAKAVREMFSDTAAAQPVTADIGQAPKKAAPAAEPETPPAKTYTFADVRKAFSAKSHAGYTEQVKALIGKYGAEKLSSIKEENYPALMADLEVIG